MSKVKTPDKVYISSHRRGFMAVVGFPMCVISLHGSSGNHLIRSIQNVDYSFGKWWTEGEPVLWLKEAWEGALNLSGDEPWRIYEIDASYVANLLEQGNHIDDIRGFENRCEKWQPISINEFGVKSYVKPADALIWERIDGWRAVKVADKKDSPHSMWFHDGSHCIADPESTLKYYPNHFDPIKMNICGITEWSCPKRLMRYIDKERPWD